MNPSLQTLDALYAAGHWLMQQDRHRDALSLFRTMMLVDARDERGWLGLAICHEKLDELEKAIELCRLAVSACGPHAVRCTIARARLHRAAGDQDEAAEAYEAALRAAEELNDSDLESLVQNEARAS
jgi:tetratricopeptide (TPR) repeat protein